MQDQCAACGNLGILNNVFPNFFNVNYYENRTTSV